MPPQTINRLLKRLKQLRKAHGLTQEQFAECAGISYKYFQAVEAGRKRDLRLSTVERLAENWNSVYAPSVLNQMRCKIAAPWLAVSCV